ncbi:MAG: hypothetical protein ABIQ95_15520, partial [Bdellovibrionia bacterium]
NYHGDYKKTEILTRKFLDQFDRYEMNKTLSEMKSSTVAVAKQAGKVIISPYYGAKYLVKQTKVGVHRFNIHQELNREKKNLKSRLGTKQGPNESKKAAFKVSNNRKKWRYLADEDVNKLYGEAYDKYISKLIKEDQGGIKNLESIQKEATYLADLFVRKSAELRIKLREIIGIEAELRSVKKNPSNLEILSNSKYESLVRDKLKTVFEDPEHYNFTPIEFDTMATRVREMIQNETARKLGQEKLEEAKTELASLGPSFSLSESDRFYKEELSHGIRYTKAILNSHIPITENHFQIIENARRAANIQLEKLEAKRRATDSTRKESFWKNEVERRYQAARRSGAIDGRINKLLAKKPEKFEIQMQEFANKYAVRGGMPSVPYHILRKVTTDLDRGRWNPDRGDYTLTEEQIKLDTELEAQAAYCEFIEAQNRPAVVSSDFKGDELKKGESGEDASVETSNAKSKETFIKNYVCLPPAPDLETFDKMEQCLICFEPVKYDYKALSDFCDVAPEYDVLIQVPGDIEAHRLTSCGHLIHKDCLEGLQINRGLAIYKCPKCPKQIPFHELDSYQRIQKHGFCLDSD